MTAPAGEEVLLARAYLMRVAEPPAFALHAFVDVVGAVEAADLVRRGDLPEAVHHETEARRGLDRPDDLLNAEKVGARLVVPEDPDWPAWQLLSLAAPTDRGLRGAGQPLGLWVRGSVPVANLFDRAVSVVGARAATGYGEHIAAELGFGLVQAGMTVVSGAAYGIDGAAHRGAISAGGPTVAVLGCGIDMAYPAGHSGLIDGIAAAGLIVSEYPPGTTPARHRFLVRNRLIAALSSATVVVEAGVRSGARNTATTAATLGKVVMAVPGPITSPMSVGCHDLLRTGGAVVAGSVAEIVEAVGPVGENLDPARRELRRSTDGLGEEALRVHDALRRDDSRDAEQVAVESGLPLDRVRTLLPELEITGHVTRHDDGWRQSKGGDRHD
jgi:DNA processing protein